MDRRTFSFEGEKEDGTRVKGTIVARNADEALSRLTQEYALSVQRLSPSEVHCCAFASSLIIFVSWLLGWCSLVFALSFYARERILPLKLSPLRSLASSPILFNTTLALFLSLLGIKLWELIGQSKLAGMLCVTLGIAAFLLLKL